MQTIAPYLATSVCVCAVVWKTVQYAFADNWDGLVNAWVPQRLSGKKVLILTNPVSGASAGAEIFRRVVKPMLEKAGASYDQVITKSRSHVLQIGQELKPGAYDFILIISGDGGFTTLLEGIAQSVDTMEDFFSKLDSFQFGIVPSGTSNSLATTLSYQYTKSKPTNCPVEAMTRILERAAKREYVQSDLYSVKPSSSESMKPSDLRWDFIGCHVGVIGEIDLYMETDLRWLPKWIRGILAPVLGVLLLPYFTVSAKVKLGGSSEDESWGKGTKKLNSMFTPDADGWYDLGSREYNIFSILKTEFLDSSMHIAPQILQGDGRLALLTIPRISRFQAIKWVIAVDNGSHVDQGIEFLNIPITEVKFTTNGRLDVAGDFYEKCNGQEIHIRIHKSNLNLL